MTVKIIKILILLSYNFLCCNFYTHDFLNYVYMVHQVVSAKRKKNWIGFYYKLNKMPVCYNGSQSLLWSGPATSLFSFFSTLPFNGDHTTKLVLLFLAFKSAHLVVCVIWTIYSSIELIQKVILFRTTNIPKI